jgi:hypothetical protein
VHQLLAIEATEEDASRRGDEGGTHGDRSDRPDQSPTTLEGDMRRVLLGLCTGILLAGSSAASALAAPPEKFTEPIILVSPDFDLGLVLFVNTDRETMCTPEQVAFEEAFLAWIEGGEVGDPPASPADPEGLVPVSFLVKETGKGAVVQHILGSNLPAEVWEMDPDAPGIGPCTDTDDVLNRIGTGTAKFRANDNDLFGSGTRGNAFGDRGVITLVDDAGNRLRYSWMFHVNSRCHIDGDETPMCLVEGTALR